MPIICFCFFTHSDQKMSYLVEPNTHAKEIFLNMVYLSEIVHNNRRKFEPYAELVDEAYEHVMLS